MLKEPIVRAAILLACISTGVRADDGVEKRPAAKASFDPVGAWHGNWGFKMNNAFKDLPAKQLAVAKDMFKAMNAASVAYVFERDGTYVMFAFFGQRNVEKGTWKVVGKKGNQVTIETIEAKSKEADRMVWTFKDADTVASGPLTRFTRVTKAFLLDLRRQQLKVKISKLPSGDFCALAYVDNLKSSDFQGLHQLPRLTRMHLVGRTIPEAMLQHVSKCKELSELSIECTSISGEQLQWLSKCKELSELSIECTSISGEQLQWLSKCKKLSRLTIETVRISDEQMEILGTFTQLEDLKLRFSENAMEEGFRFLARCKQLERLSLRSSGVRDVDLSGLRSVASLKCVFLPGTKVGDAGILNLFSVDSKLEVLGLAGTRVSDQGLVILSKFPHLRDLDLGDTMVSDKGIKELEKVTSLKSLGLCNTLVTDAGVKTIGNLAQLEELWLMGTQVTDESVDSLTKLQHLRLLDLFFTKVTEGSIHRLRQELPNTEIEWKAKQTANKSE